MTTANDSLQAIQIIVQLAIVLVGIGIQWGLMQAGKAAMRKEIDLLRSDMDREIGELKRRDTKLEDRLQIAMQNQSEMKATLSSIQVQQSDNFQRIFNKFDTFEDRINKFYQRYGNDLDGLHNK